MRRVAVGLLIVLVDLTLLTFGVAPVTAQSVTVTTRTTEAPKTTMKIECPGVPPALQEDIGFGTSTVPGNFEVEVIVTLCGYPQQFGHVHVAVTTAWINDGDYWGASNLTFSYVEAFQWASGKCTPNDAVIPMLSLDTPHYQADQNNRIYPPSHYGQGDICFIQQGTFSPIFSVDLANGTVLQLHQVPSQTPLSLVIGGPLITETQTTATTFTVTVPQSPGGVETTNITNITQAHPGLADDVGYVLTAITLFLVFLGTIRYIRRKEVRKWWHNKVG